MMTSKLGLMEDQPNDAILIKDLERVLHLTETDMTIFFRNLNTFSSEMASEGIKMISDAFYKPQEVTGSVKKQWNEWFEHYANRLKLEIRSIEERKSLMSYWGRIINQSRTQGTPRERSDINL